MEIITAGVSPITVDIAKEHLRVSTDTEDIIIATFIKAAYAQAESYLWRKVSATVVKEYWTDWEDEFCPTQEPSSDTFIVSYKDVNDDIQVLENAHALDEVKKVIYATEEDLPVLSELRNPVSIQYTTGWSTVPEDIVTAMLLMISDYFDNRIDMMEQVFNVNGTYLKSSQILLNPYRLNGF